jgi:triosephosphate isomerase
MADAPRRPLVAGNWKMNGLSAAAAEFNKMIEGARALSAKVDIIVCPPVTLLARFAAAAAGSPLRLGAQDCHAEASGAFTGDISAEMLKDAGASAVIVGHSERRSYHKESDTEVRAKVLAARRAGLLPIVCVGETRAEREAGRAQNVTATQLDGSLPAGATAENLVVAYEPVWAIGTGLTPTPADVAAMHGFVRQRLASRFAAAGQGIRILYGGSVKPSNARELLHAGDVDGALVGGASLKADEFLAIAGVYR